MPQRLEALRKLMKKEKIDAYWIPSTDAHASEYLPKCWQRRQWISGFTGSAGEVVVTLDQAGLWTDFRYYIQATDQLEGSGIDLFKIGMPEVPSLEGWVADTLKKGQKLGVDPRLLSIDAARRVERKLKIKGIQLVFVHTNLVDKIWKDQPEPSKKAPRILAVKYTGENVASKLERVREKMKAVGAKAHVITSLDDIAWLLNMRGSDIEFNPLFISYLIITDTDARLFIDKAKVNKGIEKHLAGTVKIYPYDKVRDHLKKLGARSIKVWTDQKKTNQWVLELLKGKDRIYNDRAPSTDLKSVKSDVELEGMRNAHILDGVAMVKFLKWLEDNVPKGNVTELKAAKKCDAIRTKAKECVGPSFETISGYADHGAIVHYAVSKETDVKLKPEGIYLVDCGGQYLTGTTDITRTVTLGKPTKEQKDRFTRVLRGHIDLAMLKFPKGFSGKQIEIMARKPLWDAGLNYGHGTGHGIGHYLNVHEGPMGITPRDVGVPLAPGNVMSNEPGYYKEGGYGIRTENVIVVVREDKLSKEQEFLGFETITACPIDRDLVDTAQMTKDEMKWLNDYHKWVYDTLAPKLDKKHKDWLKKKTRALRKK